MTYLFPAICRQWDAQWFELWLSHLKCCSWLLCYSGLLICVSAFNCWRFVFLQEKLYQWILRQQEEGSRVTTVDIVSYLQVFFFFLTPICFNAISFSCCFGMSLMLFHGYLNSWMFLFWITYMLSIVSNLCFWLFFASACWVRWICYDNWELSIKSLRHFFDCWCYHTVY